HLGNDQNFADGEATRRRTSDDSARIRFQDEIEVDARCAKGWRETEEDSRKHRNDEGETENLRVGMDLERNRPATLRDKTEKDRIGPLREHEAHYTADRSEQDALGEELTE